MASFAFESLGQLFDSNIMSSRRRGAQNFQMLIYAPFQLAYKRPSRLISEEAAEQPPLFRKWCKVNKRYAHQSDDCSLWEMALNSEISRFTGHEHHGSVFGSTRNEFKKCSAA